MSQLIRMFIIICAALILTACGPMRKPISYNLVPPTTAKGQRCLKQCRSMKRLCYRMCTSTKPDCFEKAKQRAKDKFSAYQKQQQAAEKEVTKTWKDFYKPTYCKDVACGCKADYRACFQMCGGKLIPIYA